MTKASFQLINGQTINAETKEEAIKIATQYNSREMTLYFLDESTDEIEKETFKENCGREFAVIIDDLWE